MNLDYTNEMIFGFGGPNLCFLGNEDDFKKIAETILDLTVPESTSNIDLSRLDFFNSVGENIKVTFSSKQKSELFGVFRNGDLIFELDPRYWERLFKFFVLMSWHKRTYYLNSFEDCLRDLPLEQECHFICSSEF